MPGKKLATSAAREALRRDPTIVPALRALLRKTINRAWDVRVRILLSWIDGTDVKTIAKDHHASATTISKTLSGFIQYADENAAAAKDADSLVRGALARLAIPRGHPFRLVGEKQARAAELLRTSGNVRFTAKAIGVSRDTLHRAVRVDRLLKEALKQGRQPPPSSDT